MVKGGFAFRGVFPALVVLPETPSKSQGGLVDSRDVLCRFRVKDSQTPRGGWISMRLENLLGHVQLGVVVSSAIAAVMWGNRRKWLAANTDFRGDIRRVIIFGRGGYTFRHRDVSGNVHYRRERGTLLA
jgi:hypothetical protein